MDDTGTLYGARHGLIERPFCPLADVGTFHWARGHTRAAAALQFGLISDAPVSVITGPSGCGKTSLLRRLVAEAGEGRRIGFADAGAGLGPAGILAWLLQALGAPVPEGGAPAQLSALQELLIEEYAAGRTTLLVVDEAQGLSDADLHGLATLSNINTARDSLLQMILSGHPDLRTRLSDARMVSLAQRVSVWSTLEPLDAEETGAYIAHRVQAAGGRPDLFAPCARMAVFRATGGVPREINKLCELTLLLAEIEGNDAIGAEAVRSVLHEGFFVPLASAEATPAGAPRLAFTSGT